MTTPNTHVQQIVANELAEYLGLPDAGYKLKHLKDEITLTGYVDSHQRFSEMTKCLCEVQFTIRHFNGDFEIYYPTPQCLTVDGDLVYSPVQNKPMRQEIQFYKRAPIAFLAAQYYLGYDNIDLAKYEDAVVELLEEFIEADNETLTMGDDVIFTDPDGVEREGHYYYKWDEIDAAMFFDSEEEMICVTTDNGEVFNLNPNDVTEIPKVDLNKPQTSDLALNKSY